METWWSFQRFYSNLLFPHLYKKATEENIHSNCCLSVKRSDIKRRDFKHSIKSGRAVVAVVTPLVNGCNPWPALRNHSVKRSSKNWTHDCTSMPSWVVWKHEKKTLVPGSCTKNDILFTSCVLLVLEAAPLHLSTFLFHGLLLLVPRIHH